MKKIFILFFILSFNTLSADILNTFDENVNVNKRSISIKKCINEYLLPCEIKNVEKNTLDQNKRNIKKTFKNRKNERLIKNFNNKRKIDPTIKIKNKVQIKHKLLSIDEIPKSELNQKISFEKFKSEVIKYSINDKYPDINK